MEACLMGATCCRSNIVKESFEGQEKMPLLREWTVLATSLSAIISEILIA